MGSWFHKTEKNSGRAQKVINIIFRWNGGTTSIDIVKPGIDKAYGIQKLKDILEIDIQDILFIGDALFEGGNDYPVRKMGVDCIQVRDAEETKRIIETIIACFVNTSRNWNPWWKPI